MTTEIDAINAKILKELLKDGRKNFVEIAKECNTSKDVIAKRYKQMKNKGIIVGATIQNSPACYEGNFVAGFYIFTQPNKADIVLELAKKIPQAIDVFRLSINPSLGVMAIMKGISELDQIKQLLKKMPYVVDVDTRLYTEIKNNPDNLSILTEEGDKKNDNGIMKMKVQQKIDIKIDKIDSQIIEILAANSRKPFKKIALELKVSTDTVVRRYERLKKNGDIKSIIQINPIKTGYYAFAIFNLSFISQDNWPEKMEALAIIPDINFIFKTTGQFDYLVSLWVKDINQLVTIKEEIASMPGLSKMEMTVERAFSVWPIPREVISTF
jgi:Lrp/AsnC family transcriptional regulator, regulator for asnA, asnC and gidA